MPNRSEYQPLAQSADEAADVPANAPSSSRSKGIIRSGHIDLSKLDAAFKRWTESIAQRVKGKKKVEDHSRRRILHSVFEPAVPPTPPPSDHVIKTLDHKPPMTKADFDAIVQSVRAAIGEGIHPKMISKGSSGSYFARAKVDGRVQIVAVFKPKDEEPYGQMNPKTTKWLHRKLRWIIPFGRSCLIPNLSYISEAAASLLDHRLNLNIVPRTELISFSSPAFFYDWLDRNAAKKGKPLPEKIGSMQCFMHGYQDASDFLRKHPWPGRSIADTFDDSNHRTGIFSKRFLGALQVICGNTGDENLYEDDDQEEERALYDVSMDTPTGQPFYWSAALQQSFREELEKLVILDYLMRNTDRGADNYMIKYCEAEHEKSLVDVAPSRSGVSQMPVMSELRRTETPSVPLQPGQPIPMHQPQPFSSHSHHPSQPYTQRPHIHIAAIDNSLSFPHEHPRGWRSFTYGWLYLPVSLIGTPFSNKTRNEILPLLTSKVWWEETTYELRRMFALDPDFNMQMFQRQLAVIKGQAWNIVQSLRHSVSPLELTRRKKVLVWDDEVEVDEEGMTELASAPFLASPRQSIRTLPTPHRRARSQSSSDFPPPIRRRSTDMTGIPRPVPFMKKYPRVHPGTTGVTVLEHMERVDAVEEGLRRLGVNDETIEEEDETEEGDVGLAVSRERSPQPSAPGIKREASSSSAPLATAETEDDPMMSSIVSDATLAPESLSSSVMEEDLVALSKSTSQLDPPPTARPWMVQDTSRNSNQTFDWMRSEGSGTKKITMISERLETVDAHALFSCW